MNESILVSEIIDEVNERRMWEQLIQELAFSQSKKSPATPNNNQSNQHGTKPTPLSLQSFETPTAGQIATQKEDLQRLGYYLDALWNQPWIQSLYKRRHIYYLNENMGFFYNKIVDIFNFDQYHLTAEVEFCFGASFVLVT